MISRQLLKGSNNDSLLNVTELAGQLLDVIFSANDYTFKNT